MQKYLFVNNYQYLRGVFVKSMGKKIQDATFWYRFWKVIVDWVTRRAYRRFQIEGLENIPKDGCTIWASNHTNALMDPLVILGSTDAPKVFVARADIFKSKPFIVKILTFLKIMPIYRIRDGFDSVKRNDEIIERAVDVLRDGVPFVIFPEATHRAKHSLLKLSKGVFHIAFAVNEKVAGEKPVYILPLGIEYGDYFRFRSTVLVKFGKPIDVTEFLRENPDLTQPLQMQRLRDMLEERLSGLISYVPDDEDYDAVWEYAKLRSDNPEYFRNALAECERQAGRRLKGLECNEAVDRYAIAEALRLRENNPEKAADLFHRVDTQRVWRIQHGVSVRSIADTPKWPIVIAGVLWLLCLSPLFLAAAVVSLIVWLPIAVIVNKVDDDAFYNTARLGVRMAVTWIYVIAFAIVFFRTLPLAVAIVLTLLLPGAHNFFVWYCEKVRMVLSHIRWKLSGKKAEEI